MSAAPTAGQYRSIAAEVCAFAPLGIIALYILLALFSRAWMGHWPRYYEYLTIWGAPAFRLIAAAFLLWVVISLLLAPLLWGVLALRARAKPDAVRHVLVYIGSWLIFILLVRADPFGFTSFLID